MQQAQFTDFNPALYVSAKMGVFHCKNPQLEDADLQDVLTFEKAQLRNERAQVEAFVSTSLKEGKMTVAFAKVVDCAIRIANCQL